MLPRGESYSAHSAGLLGALRRAGDEGLSEMEMVQAGGRWWRNRVSELCRRPGVTIGEEHGRFYLIDGSCSPRDTGQPVVVPSNAPVGGVSDQGLQLALLPPVRTGVSHYNLDEAA